MCWHSIQAMNDLVWELITTESHLVMAAMQGNAAGGVMLALAADLVYARMGVELAENILLQHRAGPLSGAPVAFSPNGRVLAAGSGDTIKLWEVQSGTLLHTLSSIHMKHVIALTFSPDGHTLAVGTDARQASCTSDNNPPCLYGVTLWDVQSGEVSSSSSFSLYTSFLTVSSLAFSPNGHVLAIADFSGVELWDRVNDKPAYTLRQDFADAVAFSPDGYTLVSGSSEYISYESSPRTFPPRIDFWGVTSGKLLRSLAPPLGSSPNSIAVSPDGHTLLTLCTSGEALAFQRSSEIRRHHQVWATKVNLQLQQQVSLNLTTEVSVGDYAV